jgi:hypothetical protein
MTAAVEDFRVTSDKLEEWKEVLPRAGPKYRLGMYFDTIHEIPEFDAVQESGYQSFWETDTEIQTDDEGGSFIFSKIDGDSASMICIDEEQAVELIKGFKLTHEQSQFVCSITATSSNKPNIEATYEMIDDDVDTNEHIYETIDDCVDEYQLFLYNDEGSPPNNVTPTHTRVTQKLKGSSYKSKRTNSLPTSTTQPNLHQQSLRKYSDCTEYSRLGRQHHRTGSFDKSNIYSNVPPPLPKPNDYSSLYKNKKTSPSHQQVVLKHKGREYLLPISDSNKTTRRHSSSSGHHSPIHHSTSTTSHLNSCCNTLPSSASFPSRRSPPQSEGIYNNTATSTNPKKKSKHTTATSIGGNTTNSGNSKHVTLYGVL